MENPLKEGKLRNRLLGEHVAKGTLCACSERDQITRDPPWNARPEEIKAQQPSQRLHSYFCISHNLSILLLSNNPISMNFSYGIFSWSKF